MPVFDSRVNGDGDNDNNDDEGDLVISVVNNDDDYLLWEICDWLWSCRVWIDRGPQSTARHIRVIIIRYALT